MHGSCTFLTHMEPTWAHHHHPKPVVYTGLCSWCCAFQGFGQISNNLEESILQHTEHFYCAKVLCALPIPCSLHLPSAKPWSFCCLRSSTFIDCYVVICIFPCLSVAWYLISFLALNNSPLSGLTTVYSPTEDIFCLAMMAKAAISIWVQTFTWT